MLIHGLAEHLGVYDELGCRLAAENFLAFGHDHGKPFITAKPFLFRYEAGEVTVDQYFSLV